MKKAASPRYGFFINNVVFHELTAEQSALIATGDQIRADYVAKDLDMSPGGINSRWGPITDRAHEGCEVSQALYKACHADREVYVKFCWMEEKTREHLHHKEHNGYLETTKPIAVEIRAKLLAFLDDHLNSLSSPRTKLGLPKDPGDTDPIATTIKAALVGVTGWIERPADGLFYRPCDFCGELKRIEEVQP